MNAAAAATAPHQTARSRNSCGVGAILDTLGPSVFVGLLLGDGTVVHANQAALDAIGAKLSDVTGQRFENAPWWQHTDTTRQQVVDAIAAGARGKASSFRVQVRRADGEIRSADFSLHPVFDIDGEVVFLVPSACNIRRPRGAERPAPDQDRQRIARDLPDAIDRHELQLVYQPQVDLVSGKIVGVEALLRWEHPTLGPVAPARLVAIADELGLMARLGDWVLVTACTQAAVWQQQDHAPVRMTVNVSATQLQAHDFAERVGDVLARCGLPAERFGIEIAEAGLAAHLDEAGAQLLRLRAMGVQIALDDFGTGQSSLTCLRRLPVDTIKIDRSLIGEVTSGAEALAIVRAIIAMAHSLGMQAFAEGVESQGQLELLAACGCDLFQGHHFSAAVSADELGRMLADGRCLKPAERLRGAGVRTVLIADNDRWALEKLREQIGWRFKETVRVETFANAEAALQRLRQGPVDVVVGALKMSGVDGMAMLNEARRLQPNAARLMLIGPADIGRVMTDQRQVDVFRYVSKPWLLDQFLTHLEAALAHTDQARARQVHDDAARLAQYMPSAEPNAPIIPPTPRPAEIRKGINLVHRGPLGEVLMPQSLPTMPGDLWTHAELIAR